jgi:serine/threonine-protein kinase
MGEGYEEIQQRLKKLQDEKDNSLVQRIGDFSFVKRLAEGKVAIIYEVSDSSGNHFSIKILNEYLPNNDNAHFEDRFKRETEALSMLHSRYDNLNLVRLERTGELDGRLFYVMEFIPGNDLLYVLNEDGPLETGKAVKIVRDIGSVVSRMHENNLVHRDLKPANIMIRPDGNSTLIDLGIIKVVYEHDTAPTLKSYEQKPHLTAKGLVLGTIGYIPPEQLLGFDVDSRGDIYALGAVAYIAISGRPPFEKEKNEKDALLVHRMRTQDPEPLIKVCYSVPSGLSDVVAKAMSREPIERYQRCEEFLEALSWFCN